ncbi:hypothetical protein C8J57DRAFT_1223152 [Mycena rebaudengoi]|nr:hypothetical protein C8J57DRAFT_1223152 [Mycena rebaudengoi]
MSRELESVGNGSEDRSTSQLPLLHPSLFSLDIWDLGAVEIIPFLRLPLTTYMSDIPHMLDDAAVLPFLSSMALQSFTFGEDTPRSPYAGSIAWNTSQHSNSALLVASGEGGLASLQTFRLIWPTYPPHTRFYVRTDELRQLVALGMQIHVGTKAKNYL